METKLGEIDRARAIYGHCSQMCDPRVNAKFWNTWKDFEVRHGNEDTLREMLRIKRSVQHQYNTQVNMMSAQMLSGAMATPDDILETPIVDSMKDLDAQASPITTGDKENVPKKSNIMFVRGETQSKSVMEAEKEPTVNPDAIDLDDDDDDSDEEDSDDAAEKENGEPAAKKSKLVADPDNSAANAWKVSTKLNRDAGQGPSRRRAPLFVLRASISDFSLSICASSFAAS